MKAIQAWPFAKKTKYLAFVVLGTAVIAISLLLAGVGYACWYVHNYEQNARTDLLRQAEVIARSLDNEVISTFLKHEAESSSPEIRQIQKYLDTLSRYFSVSHSIYLMGEWPSGEIFFLCGREYSTLAVHSTHCSRHFYARKYYEQTLQSDTGLVIGPFTNPEEGQWVSALTPIHDWVSGSTAAFLGVDTKYVSWQKRLRWPLLGIALLTLLAIACLVVGVWVYHRRYRKDNAHRAFFWEPLCLATFGLLVTIAGTCHIQQSERQRQKALFLQVASRSTEDIANIFSEIKMSELEGLSGYLETVEDLSNEKFIRFSQHLVKNSMVQALAWVPAVPAETITEFEASMRALLGQNFAVWQFNANLEKEAVFDRPVYYPVAYFYPAEGKEFMYGFDEGSELRRAAALRTALEQRLPTASEPLYLADKIATNGRSIVTFYPIFAMHSPGRLRGFGAVFLRIDKL
ncbi:MAG: CHASE domain-containing protein, partial [Lentisphaeria bacterium]